MVERKKAQEIAQSVEKLLEDQQFRELVHRVSSATVFDVIGKRNDELTHSRVLAWFLDPSKPHGLETEFLRQFLLVAARAAKQAGIQYPDSSKPIFPLRVEAFALEDVNVTTERQLDDNRRLDVAIWSNTEEWLCVIENKIGAKEAFQQTQAYYEQSQREFPPEKYPYRLFVYLTPSGKRPTSPYFVVMSYGKIKEIFNRLSSVRQATSLGRTVLDQYLTSLEADVMVNERDLRKLCRQLYKRYREAVDTIHSYGTGWGLLALEVYEQIWENLERNPIPDSSGGQIKKWDRSSGTSWAAFWPAHWPTKRGYYPVYYGIWFNPRELDVEKIEVGLAFDPPDGRRVQEAVERLAGASASDLLARKPVEAVDEGIKTLRSFIERTVVLVEKAYREALPKKWE